MSQPNITSENIEFLRKKLDLKGVYTWDLQEEMIDLFSSKIEQQWAENPSISFEKALDKEFGQYGRFDLMKLQDQLTEKLGKEANRDLWNKFKELFQLPVILATISMVISIFLLLLKFGNIAKDTFISLVMVYALFSTFLIFKRTKIFRKYQLAVNLKLNNIFPLTNMLFVVFPNMAEITFENVEFTSMTTIVVLTLIISFMFMSMWVSIQLTKAYYEELHSKYAQLV